MRWPWRRGPAQKPKEEDERRTTLEERVRELV